MAGGLLQPPLAAAAGQPSSCCWRASIRQLPLQLLLMGWSGSLLVLVLPLRRWWRSALLLLLPRQWRRSTLLLRRCLGARCHSCTATSALPFGWPASCLQAGYARRGRRSSLHACWLALLRGMPAALPPRTARRCRRGTPAACSGCGSQAGCTRRACCGCRRRCHCCCLASGQLLLQPVKVDRGAAAERLVRKVLQGSRTTKRSGSTPVSRTVRWHEGAPDTPMTALARQTCRHG